MRRLIFAALCAATLIAGVACDSIGGGPKKIVINETVCANAGSLRMDVNETYRVVVDNSSFTPGQSQLSLLMLNFPIVVKGDVPPNSTIGDPFSTVVLLARPGEEKSVDIVPTRGGRFTANCNVVVGGRSTVLEVDFQII
jgi:hypothetical protein